MRAEDRLMVEGVRKMEREALERRKAPASTDALDGWHRDDLGREGSLQAVLRGLGSLPVDQRPVVGQQANDLKARLQAALRTRRKALQRRESVRAIDLSLPARRPAAGHLHPVTAVRRRMQAAYR
jgi:phenylalanyl-tRNA synthetase alpha chain